MGSGTELDEFAGNNFLKSSSSGVVKNLAIEHTSGKFYLESSSNLHVAVDNTPEADSAQDPSACGSLPLSIGECFVYVSTAGEGGGIGKVQF